MAVGSRQATRAALGGQPERRAGRRGRASMALVLLLGLGGCRGCGCDAPPDEDAAAPAAPVDASVADASLAQTLDPDGVERAITEGLRAISKGDRATAITRFEAAVAADPGRRVPQLRLCGLHRDAGRVEEALRACRAWRAVETEPDFQARADALIDALQKGQPLGSDRPGAGQR